MGHRGEQFDATQARNNITRNLVAADDADGFLRERLLVGDVDHAFEQLAKSSLGFPPRTAVERIGVLRGTGIALA